MEEMTIAAGLNPEEDIWKSHTRIEIVVGMKAMVTMNISTEADIANGTGEVIMDILLDHREQLIQSEIEKGVVTLMYPLVMIIFKSMFPGFDGLAEGEIPLFPAEHSFQICTSLGNKVMFHYQQYTLTPGYMFTLNKGQSQILGSTIVDL